MIMNNLKTNTEIYRKVFACYPDDTVKKLDQLRQFMATKELHLYDELAPKIKGHIVKFPLNFLSEEDLSFKPLDKEYYVPYINFT